MFNDEIKMTELEKKISRLEKTAGRGRYIIIGLQKKKKIKIRCKRLLSGLSQPTTGV